MPVQSPLYVIACPVLSQGQKKKERKKERKKEKEKVLDVTVGRNSLKKKKKNS